MNTVLVEMMYKASKGDMLHQGNLLFCFARNIFIFQCVGDEICNSVDCPLVIKSCE